MPSSDLAWDIFSWFLVAVLIPAVPTCGVYLISWIKAKSKGAWWGWLMEVFTKVAMEVVLAGFQSTRASIERAKSPDSDGGSSITKEEGQTIFKQALEDAKKAIGPVIFSLASKMFGEDVVVQNLINKIEAAVLQSKAAGLDKVAKPSQPAPVAIEIKAEVSTPSA